MVEGQTRSILASILAAVLVLVTHADRADVSSPSLDLDYARVARGMMEMADVVMWGHFVAPCEGGLNHPRRIEGIDFDDWPPKGLALNERWFQRTGEATVRFRPEHVFKGRQSVGQDVEVAVSPDILAYPGFDVSRYEMRRLVIAALRAKFDDIVEQLDELEQSAGVASRAYQRTARRFLELADAWHAIQDVRIEVGSRQMLWERGGAIRCGPPYLAALYADESGTFRIPSWFDGSLWWGLEAETLRAALRRQRLVGNPDDTRPNLVRWASPCYVCW